MPQRYFLNMLLHNEKRSQIIFCREIGMLEAVYFFCSIFIIFGNYHQEYKTKYIHMANGFGIKKTSCSRKNKK